MGYIMIKIFQEVQEDPRLWNLEERMIVNHVLDWETKGKQCFSSNAFFASLLACSHVYVETTIDSLIGRKILKETRSMTSDARILEIWRPDPDDESPELDIFDQLLDL